MTPKQRERWYGLRDMKNNMIEAIKDTPMVSDNGKWFEHNRNMISSVLRELFSLSVRDGFYEEADRIEKMIKSIQETALLDARDRR